MVCRLLVLIGLLTRLSSGPLIVIMLVAIATTKTQVRPNDGLWERLYVNAASWALMAAVSLTLSRTALLDIPTVLLAVVSAFLLMRYKINSAWLVLGGATLSYGLHVVGLVA